jgi:hypothetical protein
LVAETADSFLFGITGPAKFPRKSLRKFHLISRKIRRLAAIEATSQRQAIRGKSRRCRD